MKKISGNIVELTVNDLDKCRSFWDIPSKLAAPMTSGEKKAFAYRSGYTYIGGCALSIKENRGLFSYFAVSPDFRGNGIGSRIINFATIYFMNMGLKEMRLHVHKNNTGAIRLYERNGFVYDSDITSEKIAMIKTL